MGKILNLAVIRDATANLQRIAADHPELLGQSSPEEWERVLMGLQDMSETTGATPNRSRQKALRDNRAAQGLTRPDVWVSRQDVARLKSAFPGIRGGVNWEAVINTALAHAEQHQTGANQ
ncbi:hypothetical protein [Methylomagnum sp.]